MKNVQFSSFFNRQYLYLLTVIALFSFMPLNGAGADSQPIIGHWDLTVDMGGHPAPSWLEVKLSGVSTLVGYFVGDAGSARPISRVTFQGGKVNFSIPPQ
jgi:hypothetical protein